MKFKDCIENMTEKEYREFDAFSYSLLKAIDDSGPMALVEREDKKSTALEYGTLVDILLTDPGSKDNVFHTKAIEKPTASLLLLADAMVLEAIINDYSAKEVITYEKVEKKINQLGLWSSMKDAKKILEKWDLPVFHEYITETLAAKGKIVTTPELLEAATNSAKVLLTHEYTKHYFQEDESREVLKQAIILYKLKGSQGKAKLDLINIDHIKKIIYPIDIKTGAELPSKFVNSFYHFKYYLQVISYLLAIEYIRSKNEAFKDYKIAPFTFIYISKKMPNVPCIWTVPERMLDFYTNGWENNRGFISLLDDYAYYKKTQNFDEERMVRENSGELQIYLQ